MRAWTRVRTPACASSSRPPVALGVWGVGCGVWGVGCGVWGVGCGVWGVGCGVWGVGCGVKFSYKPGFDFVPGVSPGRVALSSTTKRDGLRTSGKSASMFFIVGRSVGSRQHAASSACFGVSVWGLGSV